MESQFRFESSGSDSGDGASAPEPHRLSVSLFAAHPLMLERMRQSLLRPEFEVHAYLLPTPEQARGVELVPDSICVVDSHDRGLLEQVLLRLPPRPLVLVVGEQFDTARAFSLLFLGVRGLLDYERLGSDLARAVRVLATGAYWLPRLQMAQFLDHLLARFPHPELLAPWVRLSRRERQVLDGVLGRMSNKELAERLHVSERTVKFHVSNLLRKFRVHDRNELALSLLRPSATDPSSAA